MESNLDSLDFRSEKYQVLHLHMKFQYNPEEWLHLLPHLVFQLQYLLPDFLDLQRLILLCQMDQVATMASHRMECHTHLRQ